MSQDDVKHNVVQSLNGVKEFTKFMTLDLPTYGAFRFNKKDGIEQGSTAQPINKAIEDAVGITAKKKAEKAARLSAEAAAASRRRQLEIERDQRMRDDIRASQAAGALRSNRKTNAPGVIQPVDVETQMSRDFLGY